MKKKLNPAAALQRAAALCSIREYCVSEMLEKLSQWGIKDSEAKKIIHKLQADQFINEIRYATCFVNDKLKFNRWGKNKISLALKQKKIGMPAIQKALETIDLNTYKMIIKTEAEKKYRTCLGIANVQLRKNKVVRTLIQKGIEPEIAVDIVNELTGKDLRSA